MSYSFSTREVIQLLREISAAYEVKGNSFFQSRAYAEASESLEHASVSVKDLWQQGKLESLPGIGGSIAQHLDELFRKGEVKHFQSVKKGLPPAMFDFLQISGVGPKKAFLLSKELPVKSIEDLRSATVSGQVAELEGFGETSQANLKRAIDSFLNQDQQRMLLPEADRLAQDLREKLLALDFVSRVEPLGSLRRLLPTVGDIDLAVATNQPKAVLDFFVNLPEVEEVLGQGEVKSSVRLTNGFQIDLRVQEEKSFGSLLQYFTGSKQHNIHLRQLALDQGYSLSEYGIKEKKTGKLHEFSQEEEFYGFLGLDYIPPEIREDTGEIEASFDKNLPHLVELTDLKGDFHTHCSFDMEGAHDRGNISVEEMAEIGLEQGFEYIAVGNHSPSVQHSVAEMRKLILSKQELIDKVQEDFPQIKLLNMLEVDILSDGSLAVADDNLKLLDVAVVAIHSGFNQSKEKLTQRVIQALENKYVWGLAHPTGRLLLEREGYELDWDQVLKVCRKEKKFLEINASIKRLDLPEYLIRRAIEEKVSLAVNSDAHKSVHLREILYGVYMARRGWAEKKDILNTQTKKQLGFAS